MLDVTESWRALAIVGKWTETGIPVPDSLRSNSQRPPILHISQMHGFWDVCVAVGIVPAGWL